MSKARKEQKMTKANLKYLKKQLDETVQHSEESLGTKKSSSSQTKTQTQKTHFRHLRNYFNKVKDTLNSGIDIAKILERKVEKTIKASPVLATLTLAGAGLLLKVLNKKNKIITNKSVV